MKRTVVIGMVVAAFAALLATPGLVGQAAAAEKVLVIGTTLS